VDLYLEVVMARARVLRPGPLTVALWLGFAGAVQAQSGTATLLGTVTDTQRAVLPGATVTATQVATKAERATVTDTNGSYRFSALAPGEYAVKVELQNFRTSVRERVPLAVDSTTRLDIPLEVGSLSETVQVTADAVTLNTSDASLGNVISGTQIRELPLEARNVVGLLALQPGVVYIPKSNAETTMDPRFGSVSGARADQANVTLDGIDVNDAQNQNAFTSVLRVTLDSVQEFRVTTSNYGADQGRSSGAQVSLVTRSGSNLFSGAGYYVNRDTRFSSNEYFLKLSQLAAGDENKPALLNKNVFGGSLGGPIKKDKFFFFGNFEGLNDKREASTDRDVPSDSFRDGVLIYRCADAGACPATSVRGFSGSHAVAAGFHGLTPAELAQLDPLHLGPSLKASDVFRQYPTANAPGRDERNIVGFRFAAPSENQFRTYISRLDYKASNTHSFFGRMNFQDDTYDNVPQFPGQAPNTSRAVKNRGVAIGHDAVLGPNMVNTLRYGYTLLDENTLGLQTSNAVSFRFIDDFNALTASSGRHIGTHNIAEDFSWNLGSHAVKAGANLRWIRNDRYSNANSYHTATANGSWVAGVGRRYAPGIGACPPPANCSGLPAVASGDVAVFADSFIDILGVISEADAQWNYNIDGSVIPNGEPIRRLYASDEYEMYVQDSWQLGKRLTIGAGLRYSLYSPPYEANGVQVGTSVNLGDWFLQRGENAANGIPANASERISFSPAGPKNDKPGFYPWDKNNFAPRVSVAWTPSTATVIRGGYSLVYDRIGAAIATGFDNSGSFGLSTSLSSPANRNNETNPDIRFQGVDILPPTLPAAPPGGYPSSPGVAEGGITQSIDGSIRTPYSHVFNLVFGMDLGKQFTIEAAYVGRRGRNLLVRRDLAMPSNLVDKASGQDYFSAAKQLIDGSKNGVEGMKPIPYWENLFPDAAGDMGYGAGLSATQNIAALYQETGGDWMTALYTMDQACFPACSVFGPNAYFTEQYDSLAALSSIGKAQYDSMQLSLRKRFSRGYQFDVNYTLSKAKDHGSEVERGSAFDNFGSGGYSGFLVNSWEPDLNYSYADFDVRHQININGLVELPFGQGKALGSSAGPLLNAVIGDWSLAGIFRWTSGFPFNVINCRSCWATNWNLQGNASLATDGVLPVTGTTKGVVGGQPSAFPNPTTALDAFRQDYPGETGIRNLLRGDGYVGLDASIGKAFRMPWRNQRLRFRWDVFNLTNTPRFDTGDVEMFPDITSSFGRYNATLATCDGAAGRCMQLNLRYEF
jgi:hypothetical protein